MTFLNSNLYCGFNNGTVLALKRLTLTPLFLFNAHMHQLHNLISLTFETRLCTYYLNSNRNSTTCKFKYIIFKINIIFILVFVILLAVRKTQQILVTLGRALTPLHEDIYLSSSRYRDKIGALKKYANCLILNSWICE